MDWTFIVALVFAIVAITATIVWTSRRKKHRNVLTAKVESERQDRNQDQDQSQDWNRGFGASTSGSSGLSGPTEYEIDTARKRRKIAFWSMIGAWGATLLFLILSCTAFVGANALAVKVNVGRYDGIAASGTSLKAPWVTTDSFSTRLQTSIRERIKDNDDCVTVKADGVEACVDTTVRWVIDYDRSSPEAMAASDEKIIALWRAYGDFDAVEEKLIKPETNTAFGNVYGGYSATQAFGGSKTAELNQALATKLDAALSKYGISVDGITLGNAHLGAKDQENLNRLFASEQDVNIATNEALAATERANANNNLKPSLTREVLIDKCIAAQVIAKPAVFDDCGLDDSANGAKSPVIVSPPAR